MIAAAQAVILDDAVEHVGAAMRALPVDQTVAAILRFECDQVLAEQPDRLDPQLVDLGDRSKRMPVTAQQLAHRRAWSNLCETAILIRAHFSLSV